MISKEGFYGIYVRRSGPASIYSNQAGAVQIQRKPVDALQFHEEHGEVCPAGWDKSKKAMDASTEGVAAYLASEAKDL